MQTASGTRRCPRASALRDSVTGDDAKDEALEFADLATALRARAEGVPTFTAAEIDALIA